MKEQSRDFLFPEYKDLKKKVAWTASYTEPYTVMEDLASKSQLTKSAHFKI